MIRRILICFVLLIAAFLAYVAVTPDDFHFERSMTINALPERIFPHINDVRKFDEWNPWTKLDPQIKSEFSGPAEGVGASQKWEGNSEVGAGTMTIVESRPTSSVKMRLDYLRPFGSTSEAEFTLQPEGGQTVVTWAIGGKQPFLMRVICKLMNMNKMLTETFDKGLTELKKISETQVAN